MKLSTTDKSLDPTFLRTTGLNGRIYTILRSGLSLYIGGEFTQYDGAGALGIAKVHADTGALDSTFTQSTTGFDSYVSSVHLIGSSLYVGGGFKNYRGVPAAGLAKLDMTNGTLDTTFTQAMGFNGMIMTIANSVEQLLVFGRYTSYRGNPAYRTNWLNINTGDPIR